MIVSEKGMRDQAADLASKLLDKNHILLMGAIDEDTSLILVPSIIWLATTKPEDPIEVVVNSPGGDVVEGMAIFDTIRAKKAIYNVTVVGMAASMAAFITVMASQRRMTPGARMMFHEVSAGMHMTKLVNVEVSVEQTKLLQTQMTALIAGKLGWSIEDTNERLFTGTDKWFTSQQALDMGLIDEIVGGDLSIEEDRD